MAGVEQRGEARRVYWEYAGRKQSVTVYGDDHARKAQRIAEARDHEVTADEVYEQVTGLKRPRVANQDGPTLREWVDQWLDSRPRLSRGQRNTYRSQFDNVILPAFGDKLLTQIEKIDVARLIKTLDDKGLASTTVTRYFAALHAALQYAVEEEKIPRNPANAKRLGFERDAVRPDDTTDEHEERMYLTHAEVDRIFSSLLPGVVDLAEFLVETGTRFHEAVAIEVGKFDKREGAVRIHQAWQYDGKGNYALGATKGRNRRTLALPQAALDIVTRLTAGRKTGFIFQSPEGDRLDYSNYRNRRWEPAVAAAMRCPDHLPPLPEKKSTGPRRQWRPDEISDCDCETRLQRRPTLHQLRHTHATWLITEGWSIAEISRRLGHESSKITENTYADFMRSNDIALARSVTQARTRDRAARMA